MEWLIGLFALALASRAVRGWWRRLTYRKEQIPWWMREHVLRRDGARCSNPLCRRTRDLTLDHVFPEVLGGRTRPSNLQVLCRRCNSRKGQRVQPLLVPSFLWWAWIGTRSSWGR